MRCRYTGDGRRGEGVGGVNKKRWGYFVTTARPARRLHTGSITCIMATPPARHSPLLCPGRTAVRCTPALASSSPGTTSSSSSRYRALSAPPSSETLRRGAGASTGYVTAVTQRERARKPLIQTKHRQAASPAPFSIDTPTEQLLFVRAAFPAFSFS